MTLINNIITENLIHNHIEHLNSYIQLHRLLYHNFTSTHMQNGGFHIHSM